MRKVVYTCDLTGADNLGEDEVHHFKKVAGEISRAVHGKTQLHSLELCKPQDSNLHISKVVCSNLKNLFAILSQENKPTPPPRT